METEQILELITRRRRQILVHSIIYYKLNDNLVSDAQWAKWAVELEELQHQYPGLAEAAPYAEAFKDFEHSSGYNLPLSDAWGVRKARQLIDYRNRLLKGE